METIKLNISQLNTIIKRIIDAEEFLQVISVYGEVSNFKISAGNAYFDIKENGAQISCIKFGVNGLDIKNGDMVLLTGKLNFYVKTGKLSFIANYIEPYGLGELYKRYLELKSKLEAEGLFDSRYKKELPRFANKVGVITSETGAVIRDIVHVARKKNIYTDIIVYPARVQGDGAEKEIISGINYFEESDVDVVIIARGGGSFEDLAPFNTEKLARAIFSCKKPIISAVGHETDFSLSDFVSDMRAPTPSVAAELAFYDFNETKQNLNNLIEGIIYSSKNVIERKQDKVLDLSEQILTNTKMIKDNQTLILKSVSENIVNSYKTYISTKQTDLEKTMLTIEKLNPLSLLKSGYLIAEKQGKKLVNSAELKIGDDIDITFNDGKVKAKVINKE